MSKWIKDPLVPFIALGGLTFGIYSLQQDDTPVVIEVTPQIQSALKADFEALTGRVPDESDLARLAQDHITEELLFREALEAGMHLTSSEVRSSLVEAMRLRLTGTVDDPTSEQLINHYADNLEQYQSEPTVTFEHVFYESEAAENTLDQLLAGVALRGDSFVHGREFPGYGHSMLRGLFGQEFLEQLLRQPAEQWVGPLISDHGTHYVRIAETTESITLPFGVVRKQVERDFQERQIDTALMAVLDTIKESYEIRVEN
ncbi:MAG: peptidylprolyl isomerase [Pseudomonadota bacterium]